MADKQKHKGCMVMQNITQMYMHEQIRARFTHVEVNAGYVSSEECSAELSNVST